MNTFFLKLILFSAAFTISCLFRKRIALVISKIPIPTFLLYLLSSIPLIIFEEHINCQPNWCGKIVLPPTLLPLMIELIFLGVIVKLIKIQSALKPALFYSLAGLLYELIVGGLRGISTLGFFSIFMIIWTVIGYIFISYIPLIILTEPKPIKTLN